MILRKAVRILFVVGLSVLASGLMFQLAQAHGSMQNPVSRVYNCFLENPERPVSAACQAAVAIGGTQPLYDWNEVNIANAAGNHRALIPDGQLCGAGRAKYAGLNQARADWVARSMQSGSFTFSYRATAPHRGSFELYITNPGYSATQPLRWADITRFATVTDPPLVNGSYVFNATIPARSGRHLIYSIWQRSDSPEAFYTCSDVVFGGTNPTPTRTNTPGGPVATPTRTNTPGGPVATPTRTPTTVPGGAPAWNGNFQPYSVGNLVTFNGVVYRCIQAHTSQPTWTPAAVASLWQVN